MVSTTARNPANPWTLVYATKGAPKTLHAAIEGVECWKGKMRPATAEELEALAGKPCCKHCEGRLARLAAKTEAAAEAVAA